MSYLTVATFNALRTDVSRDIADRDRMHKRLMSMYPDELGKSARKAVNLLFSINQDRETIVFQSDVEPMTSLLHDDNNMYFTAVDTINIRNDFEQGTEVGFELIFAGLFRDSQSGKRIAIKDMATVLSKAKLLLNDAGLKLKHIECSGTEQVASAQRKINYPNYKLCGEGTVVDSDCLRQAIIEGVGGGRLWGSALFVVQSNN